MYCNKLIVSVMNKWMYALYFSVLKETCPQQEVMGILIDNIKSKVVPLPVTLSAIYGGVL